MAKLKLPKSLLRVLFPKKKKDATRYEELLFPIAEKADDFKSVNCLDVGAEEDNAAEGVVESSASSSPTIALSFSFNANGASEDNDDSVVDSAGLEGEGSVRHDRDGPNDEIALRLFNVDKEEDASYALEGQGALSESAHHEDQMRCSRGSDLERSAGTIRPASKGPLAMDSMNTNESFIDDPIPEINSETSPQQQQNSFKMMNERLTSPSAERARQKALARQKRILSKSEERLNALTGTASATLEEATRNSVQVSRKTKEKQTKVEKDRKFLLKEKGTKNEEKKKFSTVVFYERPSQSENTPEIDLFSNKAERPLSPMTASSGETPQNDERAVIDQDGFPIGKAMNATAALKRENSPISFFILLLDPKSRIFELIEIDHAPLSSSMGDILRLIPTKCTDERLLQIRYVGLCRPSDRVEFIDLHSPAFQMRENFLGTTIQQEQVQHQCILENDLLVAILEGSSGFQMCKISKPILKNSKFRDMIRRRRKSDGTEPKSVKMVEIVNASEAEESKPSPVVAAATTPQEKKEKYNALCKKLEYLSKKLHQVDEEIIAGDVSLLEETAVAVAPMFTQDEKTALTPTQEVAYRMSPKMVATELAQHIEDIFADHDVQILAIDADDDDDEESDDGTFVSARSHKSTKSMKSVRSLIAAQMEIVTSNPGSRRQRRNNTSLFESNDDNALALQIEAMAVQAEEAFERRHGKKAVHREDSEEDVYEIPDMPEVIEDSYDESIGRIPEEFESSDILDTMKSLTRGSTTVDVSKCTPSQKEAFSRNFLNTSTSMVSTMVAATHGRVNEVHVLQYLGCTIVCIAANFAQQRQEKQPVHPPNNPSFGARQIFQSAMFLAFMVNGQRYLAKVTKK